MKSFGGVLKPELRLTEEECRRLIGGDPSFLAGRPEPFARVCLAEARAGGLIPRTVVQYMRAAFCAAQGNVRITVDSDIRISRVPQAFFSAGLSGMPVTANGECVLEVKYDRFLPDYIPHLIGIAGRTQLSFSKFAASGIYY